jgi:two-component system, sensor histidine kinase and response regulator
MAKSSANILHLRAPSNADEHQLRVLLVEDSPIQQMLITQLLKQLGHATSVVSDGFEALAAMRQDDCYDAILMDCQMPLMDGYQAAKFIRELERGTSQHMHIIGISAFASQDECFTAGMDDFLSKPLNKLLLKAILGRLIREKKGAEWRAAKG